MDVSGIYMMLIAKFSSLAFSYEDGEKDEKELDFMKYVSNIKVSDFDVRSLEPPEITLTIIPFDFNTNKN